MDNSEISQQAPDEKAEREFREHMEKLLGSPVFVGLSDQAEKVRRTLLVLSLISIFSVHWDVQLTPDAPIFGLTFEGLTADKMLGGLLLLTLFSLAHFVWLSHDSFVEWRLRLTGTVLSPLKIAKAASRDGDYPEDPRQSTLYSWWLGEAGQIGGISLHLAAYKSKLDEIEAALPPMVRDGATADAFHHLLNSMRQSLDRLLHSVDSLELTFKSRRPSASLARFDGWFRYFRHTQNLRWLVIDVGIPIGLAVWAFSSLAWAISCG